MKQLLNDIQNQLSTHVPALKYIAGDWGQIDMENPPVKYPCALVEIDNIDYDTLKTGALRGRIIVKVRLFELRTTNSTRTAPTAQIDASMRIWELCETVDACLQYNHFGGDRFGTFSHRAVRKDNRDRGILGLELEYCITVHETHP